MPVLILLVLALTHVQNTWPEPLWRTTPISVAVTWSLVLAWIGVAEWLVWRFHRQLRRQPDQCGRWLRQYTKLRRWHLLGTVVFYFAVLYFAGWGWTVQYFLTLPAASVSTAMLLPGAELVLLLPFLVSLVVSWARFYEVEFTVRRLTADTSPLSRWAYVGLHARQSLILALPPFLLLFLQQVLVVIFPALVEGIWLPAFSAGFLVVLFACYPWLLKMLLNLQPLPHGPLRNRLEQAAKRMSFRCTDLLLWNTHNSVATAMLTGPLPMLRYVVFTDYLLSGMDEEEIEAVFAHEIGHVKHRHIPYYFLFLTISLIALTTVWYVLFGPEAREFFRAHIFAVLPETAFVDGLIEILLLAPLVLGLLIYMLVVFGFLSRRCERQADLYACRSVSFPAFIAALEKVADLNGIHRDRPGRLSSWRHGSIGQRVAFLEHVEHNPDAERSFQKETGLLKWALVIGLSVLVVVFGFRLFS